MPDEKSASFRELFLRNRRGLLRYFTRRVGRDDAPDLLQETFVRALRHGDLEAIADPPAFLQQIAVNLGHDVARRRKVEANCLEFGDPPEDVPSDAASPVERLEIDEKARLLQEAVDALPPRCRDVFVLYVSERLPLGEVARWLGISKNMAQKHVRLAFQRCRAALD